MTIRRKRLFLLLFSTGLIVLLLAAGRVAYVAYSLFPQSRPLFAWRHTWFAPPAFYTNRMTTETGGTVALFASGSGQASFRLYPVTDPGQTLWEQKNIPLDHQPITDSSSRTGCAWKETLSFIAPPHPGWHVLEMRCGGDTVRQSLFVVPRAGEKKARIAMLLCSNTWNAYNCWGGQSLYSRDSAHQVSFLRPQPLSDPFLPRDRFEYQQYQYQQAGMDLHLFNTLQQAGYEVDLYEARELESGLNRLGGYDLLTLSTHSEYWTQPMLEHLSAYLNAGGSLISLSGNTAAYVSRLDTARQTLHVHKSESNLWMVADSLALLRPFGTEASFYGFHSYAPYRVVTDTAWVWAGTGLRTGDVFGLKSDCYDYTNFDAGFWRSLGSLWDRGAPGAASGMEVDKVFARTPANFVLLAQGQNPKVWNGLGIRWPEPGYAWDGGGGADMGFYRHPGGGIVFTAGSIACAGALPYDERLRRVVINVVEKVVSLPHVHPERAGHSG